MFNSTNTGNHLHAKSELNRVRDKITSAGRRSI